MPAVTPARSTRRPVDSAALARVAARLHRSLSAPWLHGEVARRMAERLPVVRLQPQRIVDWGARLGGGQAVLSATYPKARITAVEDDALLSVAADTPGMAQAMPLSRSVPDRKSDRKSEREPHRTPHREPSREPVRKPWWSRLLLGAAAEPPVPASQLGAGQCQLLWSNMVLHGSADPHALFRRWQQALQVDGFLMFSTLGPGSLQGLRDLYRAQHWPVPNAPFVDMHDLGDMLIDAGFADPVMDQEMLTLTWADGEALLTELRSLGGNVDPRRFAGLRTPRWRGQLLHALQALASSDGRLTLQFEIVYGHAFRALPRHLVQSETTLPLDDMRAMVRAGRGKP